MHAIADLVVQASASDPKLVCFCASKFGADFAHICAMPVAAQAERMSTLNAFGLLRLVVYGLFGFGIPSSAVMLGIFLPYSRCSPA
jgi:hypothetical protein